MRVFVAAYPAILAVPFYLSSLARGTSQDDVGTLLESGVRLTRAERYAEAAEVFRRCVAIDAQSFEARYDLALALFALRRLPESREAIRPVQPTNDTERAAKLYVLGKIDEAAGDKAHARGEFSSAFSTAPTEENYALDYGLFLVREGDYQSAIATLARAATAHQQSPYLLLGLAMAQAFGGKRADAILTCRRIVTDDTVCSPALLLMAFSYYMSGEYQEAERAAASGLQMKVPPPYLYYLHAAALLKTGSTSYSRMLAELDEAQTNIANCTLCYFVRSKVHEAAGDIPSAIVDLTTIVTRVQPGFDQGWYRLAMLYRKQGRDRDAQTARARFEAIRANHTDPEVDLARGTMLSEMQR
ncbi:MAG: tetratricopeptide repeat protein [Bryobacteraceae bacterium]